MRCAVRDDYRSVAARFADWSRLAGRVEPVSFSQPFASEDEAAEALPGFEIVVAMRELTPIPASLPRRLPDLELPVATGAGTPPSTRRRRTRRTSSSAAPAGTSPRPARSPGR